MLMSGTASSVPVKRHLSPARAFSTEALRRMTSRVRGSDPGGTSSGDSWTRTFCQSTNVPWSSSDCHLLRLVHAVFEHTEG